MRSGRPLKRDLIAATLLLSCWWAAACKEEPVAPVYNPTTDPEDARSTIRSECDTDDECPDSRCIEIRPGGFRVCEQRWPHATECSSDDDECCSDEDCPRELPQCYHVSDLPPARLAGDPTGNICIGDGCQSDDDCAGMAQACTDGGCVDVVKCVPAGTIGWPLGTCIPVDCDTDSDCSNGYVCAPVEGACGGAPNVMCVAPRGCRRNADCGSDDEPPYERGETFCDFGSCTTVSQGVYCD